MEFNGDSITSMEELQRELEFYAKGDTVKVKVMTMTVNVLTRSALQADVEHHRGHHVEVGEVHAQAPG